MAQNKVEESDEHDCEVTKKIGHKVLTPIIKGKSEHCSNPISSSTYHDLPFCLPICFWIKFIDNFTKLGKYFVDDILQFLKPVWSNLGNIIHDDYRVNSICFLRLIFQYITK